VRPLASQKVCVAFPYGSDWSARFGICLFNLGIFDATHSQRIVETAFNSSGANITNSRNEIVKDFLDKHTADWLFWVDTDMTFDPDVVDRLVKSAHPEKRPIVGALCFSLKDGMRLRPTVYALRPDDKVGVIYNYPPDELFSQVGGQPILTGTGCVLMHRSVLEKMRAANFSPAYPWFQETAIGGLPVGEDISFMVRAMSLGIPVHVDSSIKVGHEKTWVLTEPTFVAQQSMGHTADVPTFVVVPVKDRHDLTAQLLASLEGQGYADIFLFDNGSVEPPPAEWNAIPAAGMNIHEMWNRGVEIALEQMHGQPFNVAILNNDIKIEDEFLDRLALALRSEPRLVLVSPNYDNRDLKSGDIQEVKGICAGRYDGTGGFAGFAFVVKGEWFERGYRFPEDLDWWFGDNDIAMSIEQAGGMMGIVGGVPCEHIGGGSQTPPPPDFQAKIRADGETFKAKWSA
jgi:GT2 family glycosyltransferase